MPAMQMNTLEDAIWTWVQTSSGLPADRVVWSSQNSPVPANPYITLRMRSIRAVGSDWLHVEDNPSPSSGAEILLKLRGMRRVTLAITCYGVTPIGAGGPAAIVSDVLASVGLPSIGDTLAASGVGLSNLGDVQAIDGVVGSTLLEPRATADVIFFATSELVETATYIEHVVATRELPDPDETFTV